MLQDYPSVGQISAKLRENNIIPIFAVEQRSIDIYQVIHYTLAVDGCMNAQPCMAKMKLHGYSKLLSVVHLLFTDINTYCMPLDKTVQNIIKCSLLPTVFM